MYAEAPDEACVFPRSISCSLTSGFWSDHGYVFLLFLKSASVLETCGYLLLVLINPSSGKDILAKELGNHRKRLHKII